MDMQKVIENLGFHEEWLQTILVIFLLYERDVPMDDLIALLKANREYILDWAKNKDSRLLFHIMNDRFFWFGMADDPRVKIYDLHSKNFIDKLNEIVLTLTTIDLVNLAKVTMEEVKCQV